MERLDLKKFENLETNLSFIFGGDKRNTKLNGGTSGCDVHDDANGNGEIDAGECVEVVDCK